MFNGIFTKNINQMIIIVIRGKTKVIYAPGNVSVGFTTSTLRPDIHTTFFQLQAFKIQY
jgi:hypothetical protein